MKKRLKLFLGVLGGLLLLLVLVGFLGWRFLQNTFIDFEEEFAENKNLTELTVDSYTFLDRNGNGELDVYEDDRQPLEARVADVLAQMTQEEKIHLLKGSGLSSAMGTREAGDGVAGAVGTIVATPRLGLPEIYLSDGPAGLRILPTREGEDRTYYCTAFPIATVLASTWNETLVHEVGAAMGNEAEQYGIDVILGPGVNLHRHPLCGRNFEYYSEDPLLSGYMGAAMVNGIESQGVGACPKHFVVNNQETERFYNDARLSERALRELYLKGFEHIVKKAQPWTIMSSYNKINGTYASENRYLLTDVLRGEWDYQGLVMTDWFGLKDAPTQVGAGNDLLEPGTKRQWEALLEAAESGALSQEAIDLSASRLLSLIFKTRKMQDHEPENNPDLKAHAQVTRQSASEGMILLKNDGTLPLRSKGKVALLGTTSYRFIAGGTGSGDVNEAYSVSLEEGLRNAGFDINAAGQQVFEELKNANPEAFAEKDAMEAMMNPSTPPEIQYTQAQLDEIVAGSDLGILTIGRNAGEGGDRVEKDDFLLSEIEQEMIRQATEAFHAAGKKLIVVLNIGGVIETASWKDQPDAILLAWQGGQEGGNSVADILSGAVNPSGKLPMTFPVQLADHASHANFPPGGGTMDISGFLWRRIFPPEDKKEADFVKNLDYTNYEEGIYVGYRHFDKKGLAVSYPFGFGLSYTEFEYGDMTLSRTGDSLIIGVEVKNTGNMPGKESVQVYMEKVNPAVDRPTQELKSFAKTRLLAGGASQTLEMMIPLAELAYWDEEAKGWRTEKGAYRFHVAANSRDLRQSGEIEIE